MATTTGPARTVGETLRRSIPEGKAQKVIAAEWLEAWVRRGGEALSIETVETRLSDALNCRDVGIKALFGDSRRRETTFEVIRVDEKSKVTLVRLVEEVLVGDGRVRVVIDATSGPQSSPDVDRMFTSLKARFLGADALYPIRLLLTESQYDRLPRSFDADRRIVAKQVNSGDAAPAVEKLASEGALIASPERRVPYEQWLALRLDTDASIEPVSGLATYRDGSKLEGPPPAKRPLAKIAEPPARACHLPTSDPLALRRLAFALARGDEETSKKHTQEDRLAWAHTLGIEASATEAEWQEALPRRIAPIQIYDGAQFERVRALAQFAPIRPMAFRDGNTLTLINPPADVREDVEGNVGIVVCNVSPTRRPTLERFFLEASRLTELDVADDPRLEHLVSRHATDLADRSTLDLARSALFASHVLQPRRPPAILEWRKALQALLHEVAAEASLLVEHAENDGVPKAWLGQKGLAHTGFQPLAAYRTRRDDSSTLFIREENRATVRIPHLQGEPELWTQQYVDGACGVLVTGPSTDTSNYFFGEGWIVAPQVEVARWNANTLVVPADVWSAADCEVAFVVHALRDAIADGVPPLALPDGKVLVALGGGVFAELVVNEQRARNETPTAALLVGLVERSSYPNRTFTQTFTLGSLTQHVPMYQAETRQYVTDIGPRLPRAVEISGRGLRARITFRASPLFADAAPRGWHAAALAGAEMLDEADAEEERQRQATADDGDDD